MNTPQILLLEDHGLIRAGFKALLKETMPTADVQEATGYDQAIAILSSRPIDFAFLDFKLSETAGPTGLDILEYIRSNQLSTRAVILSGGLSANGYLDKELVLQCLAAGAFGYIPKAMEGEEVLHKAFETVFHGQIYLPASFLEGAQVSSQSLESLGIKGRLPDVLYYLCHGCVNKTIADATQLSENTVRDYVSQLLKLFKVKNRTQLAVAVARQGVVIPKPLAHPRKAI